MTAKQHLSRVHAVACVVCTKRGQVQTSPTIAHHLEVVRDKDSDYGAVALCNDCHVRLHNSSRRTFEMETKLTPIDMLLLTIKAIDDEGLMT